MECLVLKRPLVSRTPSRTPSQAFEKSRQLDADLGHHLGLYSGFRTHSGEIFSGQKIQFPTISPRGERGSSSVDPSSYVIQPLGLMKRAEVSAGGDNNLNIEAVN